MLLFIFPFKSLDRPQEFISDHAPRFKCRPSLVLATFLNSFSTPSWKRYLGFRPVRSTTPYGLKLRLDHPLGAICPSNHVTMIIPVRWIPYTRQKSAFRGRLIRLLKLCCNKPIHEEKRFSMFSVTLLACHSIYGSIISTSLWKTFTLLIHARTTTLAKPAQKLLELVVRACLPRAVTIQGDTPQAPGTGLSPSGRLTIKSMPIGGAT